MSDDVYFGLYKPTLQISHIEVRFPVTSGRARQKFTCACKFFHLDASTKAATAKKCIYVNSYELFNVFLFPARSSLLSLAMHLISCGILEQRRSIKLKDVNRIKKSHLSWFLAHILAYRCNTFVVLIFPELNVDTLCSNSTKFNQLSTSIPVMNTLSTLIFHSLFNLYLIRYIKL